MQLDFCLKHLGSTEDSNSQSLTISIRRFCIASRIRFLPGYVSILHRFAQRSYIGLRVDLHAEEILRRVQR